ncbi:MAG: PepSY-like domain-containing protein [Cytophagaceae bacterium]|nr:PepSY-like domain-containing protein [Cytophagaceae bacterium]
MKNLITTILLTICFSAAYPQMKRMPLEAISSLTRMYPDIDMKTVDWGKYNKYYTAGFNKKGEYHKVYMEKDGSWVLTEIKRVSENDLPDKVKVILAKPDFKSWQITYIKALHDPLVTSYEIKLEKGSKNKFLYLDENGNNIKKISVIRSKKYYAKK